MRLCNLKGAFGFGFARKIGVQDSRPVPLGRSCTRIFFSDSGPPLAEYSAPAGKGVQPPERVSRDFLCAVKHLGNSLYIANFLSAAYLSLPAKNSSPPSPARSVSHRVRARGVRNGRRRWLTSLRMAHRSSRQAWVSPLPRRRHVSIFRGVVFGNALRPFSQNPPRRIVDCRNRWRKC